MYTHTHARTHVYLLLSVVLWLDKGDLPRKFAYDDDVGLHVLGCRVDILGTNCNQNLHMMMMWGFMSSDVGLTY